MNETEPTPLDPQALEKELKDICNDPHFLLFNWGGPLLLLIG